MPLFGKSQEKLAREAAAKAEAERLMALPVTDVAAELMEAFRPSDGTAASGKGDLQIAMWTMRSFKGGDHHVRELKAPVAEGLQVLINAGLLVRTESRGPGWLKVTRAGETALAQNNVRECLQEPPTC